MESKQTLMCVSDVFHESEICLSVEFEKRLCDLVCSGTVSLRPSSRTSKLDVSVSLETSG